MSAAQAMKIVGWRSSVDERSHPCLSPAPLTQLDPQERVVLLEHARSPLASPPLVQPEQHVAYLPRRHVRRQIRRRPRLLCWLTEGEETSSREAGGCGCWGKESSGTNAPSRGDLLPEVGPCRHGPQTTAPTPVHKIMQVTCIAPRCTLPCVVTCIAPLCTKLCKFRVSLTCVHVWHLSAVRLRSLAPRVYVAWPLSTRSPPPPFTSRCLSLHRSQTLRPLPPRIPPVWVSRI
jgi:hypothetical protein